MGSVSYKIIIRCICGEIKEYKLNCYKNPLVIVGKKQSTSLYPQIELCSDDENEFGEQFLSRTTLYFAYGYDKKDWILGNGFPDKKYECEQLYKDKFYRLSENDIQKLSDISGIGIFPINNKSDKFRLYYKKQEILGLKHPVLPNLPFGWYIEIKSNVTFTKAMLSRMETKL